MSLRARLLIILGALSAFGPLTTDVYLPALPSLARDFAVPVASVQITLTACILGLAVGQVLVGPVADALGRKRPLLWGLAAFTVASLVCALARTPLVLDLARLAQGLTGAAGIVISRAIVRDLYDGREAAEFFSTLGGIMALGPLAAPALGGLILLVTTWPGVFVFLTAVGALLWIAVAIWIPETLAPELRRPGGLRASLTTYRALLTHRAFMASAVPAALAFAALFAYISASSFVYQRVFGFSPQVYSLFFGLNGAGILLANLVNARLTRRLPPALILRRGLLANAGVAAALAVAVVAGAGVWVIAPLLFCFASTMGFIMGNSVALAMEREPARAGSASALFGVLQFGAGAAMAPLVGIGGVSAVPMGVVMAIAASAGAAIHLIYAPSIE